jgi:cyclopropane-fatty-acyl-phospholipid synthase
MDYIRVIDTVFSQLAGPKFAIKLWDGKTRRYGCGPHPVFTLQLTNSHVFKRLLAEGALGFGESYMDGSLQVAGDLEEYLKLRHQLKKIKPTWRLALAKFIANLSVPRSTRKQIAYHYDLGNDFFKLFLDHATLSYSAGHYASEHDSLDQAQINKLKLVCEWMNLPKHASVLDLGSGWGSFAEYAATNHYWYIHGLTLSQQQVAYAQKQIKMKSLISKINYEYQDFCRQLPAQKYDGMVMIEAIEHVGQANINGFIKQVSRHLKPGAPFYIQFTGRYEPKLVDPWTLKYVFPGGHLPAKAEFLEAVHTAGLTVEKFEDHTKDYSRTILTWVESLENHQSEIEDMFDASFFRLWKLWMRGAHVNFEIGAMNLFRTLLRKP